MMRCKISILCVMFLYASSVVSGQRDDQQEKRRFVAVPPENYLLVIASQPDCPLEFENAKLLAGVDSGWGASYRLRNRGTKAIRNVSVAAWNSRGTGGTLDHPWENTGELIMPGQAVPKSEDGSKVIVALTDELRDKLKLRGPMRAVVVLVVEEIDFVDGSTYRAETISKALQGYFEELGPGEESAAQRPSTTSSRAGLLPRP